MKTFLLILALLGAAATAKAQTTLRVELTSTQTPQVTGAGAFVVEEDNVRFTISFTMENVVPTTAQIVGPQSSFAFDLGEPRIAVHSPGPWPNGYDGSTAFFGAFEIPTALRADFIAGRTTLQLLGSDLGDFSGPILPAALPQILGFNNKGTNMQIRFMAQSPYRFTVERSASVGMASSIGFTNVAALSQTFEVVVQDLAETPTRFYRLRRELYSQ